MQKKKIIISLLLALIAIIGLLIPFIFIFKNSELSYNPVDWGSFGSYLSGVISVINLFVFIYITLYLITLDENRSNHQIKTHKKITLTQFRQSELEKLTSELSKPLDNDGTEEASLIVSKSTKASVYLTNFFNQKNYLFPILFKSKYLKIQKRFDELILST